MTTFMTAAGVSGEGKGCGLSSFADGLMLFDDLFQ